MLKNKNAQAMAINILFLGMTIAIMVAMIPMFQTFLGMAQQSDGLNCPGYYKDGNTTATLSYNSSLETNTLTCLAIDLYLPYIVLAILIGGVGKLLAGRVGSSPGGI